MGLLDRFFKRKPVLVEIHKKKDFVPSNLMDVFNLLDIAIDTNDLYSVTCSNNNCSRISNLLSNTGSSISEFSECTLKLNAGSFLVGISIGNIVKICYEYGTMFDPNGLFTSNKIEFSLIEDDIDLLKHLFMRTEDYFGYGLTMELWEALDHWENA